MRIIAGQHKGRALIAPKGMGTRPTSDRTRESLFNVIAHADWAPAIEGGLLLTTRGGDFSLHLGQDISIGYQSHSDDAVRLYLQESFTFRLLSPEAAVALTPPAK